MAFFSSLILFQPGLPPLIEVSQLREFCERLRAVIQPKERRLGVELKFGPKIDQDVRSTSELVPTGVAGMYHLREFPWDYQASDAPWEGLWPGGANEDSPWDKLRRFILRRRRYSTLYRAHVAMGGLPEAICAELGATGNVEERQYITPDSLSVAIDPVAPGTLGTLEEVAYGFVKVSFSGYGYFSWRPLAEYWEQIRGSPTLHAVQSVCREVLPATPFRSLENARAELGELFLNAADYQAGDWVVSVSETG